MSPTNGRRLPPSVLLAGGTASAMHSRGLGAKLKNFTQPKKNCFIPLSKLIVVVELSRSLPDIEERPGTILEKWYKGNLRKGERAAFSARSVPGLPDFPPTCGVCTVTQGKTVIKYTTIVT
jgi:hypothetical protein